MDQDQAAENPPMRYWLAYGNDVYPPMSYYQGTYAQDSRHDIEVPQRLHHTCTWVPNPERPTVSDWKFDGHDADGGSWSAPTE